MIQRRRFHLALGAVLAFGLILATPVGAEDPGCVRIDLEVECSVEPSHTILIGDPFTATATVRNSGTYALQGVKFNLRGQAGVVLVEGENPNLEIPKLEPGETKTIRARFVSHELGERRIVAHAAAKDNWAAAGCFCGIRVEGLPALQVEMIDKDENGQNKGIFEVGEVFKYTLVVENDVGTAVTPDLRVKWTLPTHLEFVSGVGDRGVTVTGAAQDCESSEFQLGPNQVQNFEINVRVVSVPERNLIQTEAVVLTSGDQRLAMETESTTLKSRS